MPGESKETLQKNQVRKDHIIKAALSLFSEKGFENTRVDEIAREAGVNKALIYYHFESKEALLSYLLEEFFVGVKALVMDYIVNHFIKPIQKGDLDILPDRLRFVNEEALVGFMNGVRPYIEKILDYFLANRDTVRLLLAESLKRNNNHMDLFRFVELLEQKESNPLYQTIHDADNDFTYSRAATIGKFFYSTLPLLNIAAYFDDYIKVSSMSEEELRAEFTQICMNINPFPIQGRDVIMTLGGPVSIPQE